MGTAGTAALAHARRWWGAAAASASKAKAGFGVYGRLSSSNTQKVLWMMEEVGQSYKLVAASARMGSASPFLVEHTEGALPYGLTNTEAYRALNPHGRIPMVTLPDANTPDTALWESHSIIRYLADTRNATHLYGASSDDGDELALRRALCSRWMAQLQAVIDNVDALKRKLAEAEAEAQSLQEQTDLAAARLGRAGKLTSALADEQVRWQETADKIADDTVLLVGDVFLGAAAVSYFGAFTGNYRDRLVAGWVAECKERGIPVSDAPSMRDTLASPVEIRDWNIYGLPTDSVSLDNGVLVTRGKRCGAPTRDAGGWGETLALPAAASSPPLPSPRPAPPRPPGSPGGRS